MAAAGLVPTAGPELAPGGQFFEPIVLTIRVCRRFGLLIGTASRTPRMPRARTAPRSVRPAFEVRWTTSGDAGILEEVADKEPS